MGLLDGFLSLGAKVNKTKGDGAEPQEGAAQSLLPELTLEMPDEDLLKLTKAWQKKWDESEVKKEWQAKAEDNERYWLGKHFSDVELQNHPLNDNAIFEALETFLPQATRRNPEPGVEGEDAEFADQVEKELIRLADDLKVRLKIKKAARHWSIYLLGVAKVGWSLVTDDITLKVIRPFRLILDPDGTVDEDGYTGQFIGELRTTQAAILAKQFPAKKDVISGLVQGKLGTDITYIEWWTTDYTCYTLKDELLGKQKNVHWNYDQQTTQEITDDFGEVTAEPMVLPGMNHFPAPRMPYVFLSIFNLGKSPVDDTSLIGQNLAQQDLINKRLRQIDKNADSQNNGMIVSLGKSGLTKEQATQVSEALRKGGVVAIPDGSVAEAIQRDAAPSLSADVYTQLVDTRTRLQDIFGTRGSTPSGIAKEDTVRGKIITRGLDTDRIGGGVTEYLEQFADDIFNWFVQLMYVYKGLQGAPVTVSVKEGSLLPKDNVTQANQAIELWSASALDPITLFEKLEYPNPQETAKKLFLWQNAPQMLFEGDPDIAMFQQMQAQQAQAQAAQTTQQQSTDQAGQQQLAQMNNDAKMQQIQAKAAGDLLKQVPTQ